MSISTSASLSMSAFVSTCIHVCIYIYVYTCIYVHIYIHAYMACRSMASNMVFWQVWLCLLRVYIWWLPIVYTLAHVHIPCILGPERGYDDVMTRGPLYVLQRCLEPLRIARNVVLLLAGHTRVPGPCLDVGLAS